MFVWKCNAYFFSLWMNENDRFSQSCKPSTFLTLVHDAAHPLPPSSRHRPVSVSTSTLRKRLHLRTVSPKTLPTLPVTYYSCKDWWMYSTSHSPLREERYGFHTDYDRDTVLHLYTRHWHSRWLWQLNNFWVRLYIWHKQNSSSWRLTLSQGMNITHVTTTTKYFCPAHLRTGQHDLAAG